MPPAPRPLGSLLRVRDGWGRLARSVMGASAAALGAAVLDAAWARGAAGQGRGLGGFAIYLADLGLIAPVAVAVGIAAGLAGFVLDPAAPPSPRSFVAALRLRALGNRAAAAAFVPLLVLGAFAWMTLSAHLARALLVVDVRPLLSGVAIASGAVALGLLVGLAVLALTPPLRRALATASEGRPACVDPVFTGVVALTLVGALFAFGVVTGTVSGDGGVLAIHGIFKRPELDLRAPAILLALALAGLFAPAATPRVRTAVALAIGLAPAILTFRAAFALNDAPAVAAAIERGAPLGKPALSILRRLTDRDHDGFSGLFGGGDCDDHDPRVNPGATEPDKDCSGATFGKAPPPAAPSSASAGAGVAAPRSAASPPSAPPAQPAPPPGPKPAIPADLNLVLITIDTVRADLHYAGNPRELSPNLDQLAERSVVFDRAYSLASYTGKSVGPLMIGKYGSETHRNWGHSNSFSREDTFLAQRLQKAGFHTMAVHALLYFGAQSGMDRGFDVVDMKAVGEGTIKAMENSVTGDRLTDAALALLARPESTRKRFFFWMHYLDAHADYLPHPELPSFGASQRDLYDGEVQFVDHQLGRVLEAIAAAPWGKRTAVIVTSDHGEAFGEHKMVRHGAELWEELIRVPLLVYVPGVAPGHVTQRRSAVDLVPTILDLLGVPAPAPGAGRDPNDFLSGVSFLSDVFAPASAQPRDVLVDMPDGPFNDPRRSLLHGDYKLTISNGARYELYDLAKDPEERTDLWEKGSPEAREIEPFYAAARARLHEVRVTGDKK